jgi:hypothetical protein
MSELSKENKACRKELRKLVEYAEVLGHESIYPIKVVFNSFPDYEGRCPSYAYAQVKGKGNNRHFEIGFDEKYVTTPHGRDLCTTLLVHELAHVYTWSADQRIEDAKTAKYGEHGPEFGIVYAQLWTDLMDLGGEE